VFLTVLATLFRRYAEAVPRLSRATALAKTRKPDCDRKISQRLLCHLFRCYRIEMIIVLKKLGLALCFSAYVIGHSLKVVASPSR